MSENQSPVKGVATRYATALFELAKESNKLESVESELAKFEKLLLESSDLMRLVRSPVFSVDEKMNAMAAVLEKIEIKGLVANFVLLVAKNARLFVLPGMIRAFHALVAENRGEIMVEVQTAVELSDSNTQELKKVLHDSLGKEVMIDANVDENLLGGIVVKVGSRMIDASLRTKLNSLKFAMKEVG